MEYRILGPLEVLNGNPVDLGGHKQRSVLAILLIEAGRTVSTDAVIDRLWGDDVPATAQGTLQAYISNLRKALEPHRSTREGPSILVSRPGGYALQIAEGELDAERFEQLAREGAALLAKENCAAARQSLMAAQAMSTEVRGTRWPPSVKPCSLRSGDRTSEPHTLQTRGRVKRARRLWMR